MPKDSSFKTPPKRFHPKGLTILHEDRDIIVVDKIQGLLTISTDREKEKTAHFLLNDYVKKGDHRSRNRVFIVHRLDRETSGVLVFAKSEEAKNYLQDYWQEFSKTYVAVVHGKLQDREGVISSYLAENSAFRVYSTKNPDKGKFSETGYRVLKESDRFSLLEINLFTGRKHQIRVHLAENGHPVVGDKIYGTDDRDMKRLALHASSLTITHPYTENKMTFETDIPSYFEALVQ